MDAQHIRELTGQRVPACEIIVAATTPPGTRDYQRRLRLWAADCAARSVHLIRDRREDYAAAVLAIVTARHFARGLAGTAALKPFNCRPGSSLYSEVKHTAFSVASEVRLAAELTAQVNVWSGALGAVTYARRAIVNAKGDQRRDGPGTEADWQVGRLLRRLTAPEPADWWFDY